MKYLLTQGNSRWFKVAVFLVPLLCLFFIFREVIFQSKIFSHLDVLITFVPYYDFLSHGAGLITPSILSGFPVYVSTNSSWFNPVNKIFFSFFDAVDTFRILDVSYLVLAYVFSYLFMRRIRIGHFASIFGAMVFVFAGQVMLWSETIIITNYYFLLPLSLYIIDLAVHSKFVRGALLYLLLGVCLGWGWVSGHVQFLIYIHTLALVYFVFLLWQQKREGKSVRSLIPSLVLFGFSMLVSFLVGFKEIHAILNFLPVTARASGVTLDAATAYAYAPHHLIYYFLPYFKFPYISLSQSFQNYFGLLPLFIFCLSFLTWQDLRKNKYFSFFFGVLAFCFVASIKYSPIAFILHQLPFYSSFRETFRLMFIGDFALGIVVAMAIEKIYENRERIYPRIQGYLLWARRIFFWLVLPIIALVTLIKIFLFTKIEDFLDKYFVTHIYSKTVGGFPLEHYYAIISSYLHQAIDQLYILDSGIIILIIFGVSSYLLVKHIKDLSLNAFIALGILLTALNFGAVYVHRIVGIPKDELLSLPHTAEFIKNREGNGGSFRIFSPLMATTMYDEETKCVFPDMGNWDISNESFVLRKELIEPDLTILYNLESADGYEPYVPVRISEILGYVGSRFSTTDNHSLDGEKTSLGKKVQLLIERKNILRALNVKYVLSLVPITDRDFREVYKEDIGKCKSSLYMYELRDYFPRYFVTNNIVNIKPDEPFLSQMSKISTFNTPAILLESQTSLPQTATRYMQPVSPTLTENSKREFSLLVPQDGFLFVGDALIPGWHASVDGVETPILRANYMYGAVFLLAGHHTVKLEYTP
jgi:hypothetical protein